MVKLRCIDFQNCAFLHVTIEMTQKIVGVNIVKPFVDFKKPFADIPRIIANNKKIYPDKFVIS